jgi:hypothetical protein
VAKIDEYNPQEMKDLYKSLLSKPADLPRYANDAPWRPWKQTKSYLGWRTMVKRVLHILEVRAYLTGKSLFVSQQSPAVIHVDMLDRMMAVNGLHMYLVDTLVGVTQDGYRDYQKDLLITDIEMVEEEGSLITFAAFERYMQRVGTDHWKSGAVKYRVTDWDALTGLHRNKISESQLLPTYYAWWYYNNIQPTQGVRLWWRILGAPLEMALDGLELLYEEAHRRGAWESYYKVSVAGNRESRKFLMHPWDI